MSPRATQFVLISHRDWPVSDLVPGLELLTTPSGMPALNLSQENKSLAPG